MPRAGWKTCFCNVCKGNVVLSKNIVTRHIQTYGTFHGFTTDEIDETCDEPDDTLQQQQDLEQVSVTASEALSNSFQEDVDALEPQLVSQNVLNNLGVVY